MLQSYAVSPGIGTQCVPYARSRSGIKIFGDAYTWWDGAEGQYARGNLPMLGSVLVLSKTKRLRRGHVGVVTAIVSEREIRLDHANWQPDAIITNMAVMDVSPANDWSQLRFWNKDTRKWGADLSRLRIRLQPGGQGRTERRRYDRHLKRRQRHPRNAAAAAALTSSGSRRSATARGCGTTSRARPAPCCNRMPSRCARAARR